MNLLNAKNTVYVEVCVKQSAKRLETLTPTLETAMEKYLQQNAAKLRYNVSHKIIEDNEFADTYEEEPETDTYEEEEEEEPEAVLRHVESFLLECDAKVNPLSSSNYQFRFYVPHRREMEFELLDDGAGGDAGESLPASKHWLLPSNDLVGLWENLIYEHGLKEQLLKFAISALSLSQHNVNTNIISCNRLLLLHGPPGTGKTSLCKALAQKLAIRARTYFQHAHLIEINSHSLFSKWFSESGKLVMRLFAKIHEIIADPNNLVCVLIDEVESLAYARNAMSGQEPQDAMRVVNALLTQLDGIKEYPNVLILATSNLADTIDLAFVDRADIKQFIGLPTVHAIARIYESIFLELMRVGILQSEPIQADDNEGLLTELANRSSGLSGRTLRKLPFLAHTLCTSWEPFETNENIPLGEFVAAMFSALEKHQQDKNAIQLRRQ